MLSWELASQAEMTWLAVIQDLDQCRFLLTVWKMHYQMKNYFLQGLPEIKSSRTAVFGPQCIVFVAIIVSES